MRNPQLSSQSLNLPCLNLRCMPDSLHSSFVCLLLLYPQPFSDVFGIEVLNVEETCVSLNDMDVRGVVQCVGKGEEVVGIEEIVAIKVVDDVWDEAFLEHVFIAGGVMTISAIGIRNNPGG